MNSQIELEFPSLHLGAQRVTSSGNPCKISSCNCIRQGTQLEQPVQFNLQNIKNIQNHNDCMDHSGQARGANKQEEKDSYYWISASWFALDVTGPCWFSLNYLSVGFGQLGDEGVVRSFDPIWRTWVWRQGEESVEGIVGPAQNPQWTKSSF